MKFVTIYKVLMLAQKRLNKNKEQPWDGFVAAALGGYFIFGDRTAVNEQVCILIMSIFSACLRILCRSRYMSVHGWLLRSSREIQPSRELLWGSRSLLIPATFLSLPQLYGVLECGCQTTVEREFSLECFTLLFICIGIRIRGAISAR